VCHTCVTKMRTARGDEMSEKQGARIHRDILPEKRAEYDC
jgi:hypothetical protein